MNNKQSWISVKDSLPNENVCVLVTGEPYSNRGKMITLAMRDNDQWSKPDDSFNWYEIEEDRTDFMTDPEDLECITHWTPIPALP